MSDLSQPRDGELLSAYLAGELDADAAARLEARLADEPALAARLERTREILEGLARLDTVEPPAGYEARLRERLEAARATPAAPADEATAPTSLATARAERESRRRARWPVVGAVAASVIGLAVLGGLVVGDGLPTADEVAMDAAEEPEADFDVLAEDTDDAEGPAEAQPETLDAPDDESAPDMAEEPERLHVPAAVPSEPLLTDEEVALADADDVADYLAGSPGEGLLGLPVREAEDLEAAFAVALRRAAPFASGHEPAACLDVVTAGAEQPVVVAQVSTVVYDTAASLAYVTATARRDADTLDRVEAWVVEPPGCATHLFIDVTP